MNDGRSGPERSLPIPQGEDEGRGIKVDSDAIPRSASIIPLLVLYQRAWDLARAGELSLERLERAAEAVALADAILHLLAEVEDEAGRARWTVRLSEARHWCGVVRDALTAGEEDVT